MRSQKGQGLLEFAFVLPFLILIMFGLFYAGMLFSDYIELNNLARMAAREAAVISQEDYNKNDDHYKPVRDKFTTAAKGSSDPKKYFLPNSLYIWDFSTKAKFDMEYDKYNKGDQSVTVTLVADVNEADGGMYNSLSKQFNVARKISVEYTMHSEYDHSTTTSDS